MQLVIHFWTFCGQIPLLQEAQWKNKGSAKIKAKELKRIKEFLVSIYKLFLTCLCASWNGAIVSQNIVDLATLILLQYLKTSP